MDLNFMFTRDDRTLDNCLEIHDQVRHLGLRHMGFKDIGADLETLRELNSRIQGGGATSYLELVSTTHEACLDSARLAVEIGVDRLMGGIGAEQVLGVLEGTGIEYLPFPGQPQGHPTRLLGTPESVAEDCRRYAELGCRGVDLLAFRAVECEPLELVRAARAATEGHLLVAGSIDSPQRVRALAEAGVDSFTVGTAAFERTFAPARDSLVSQLEEILAAAGS